MQQSRDLIVCRKFRVPIDRTNLERMAYVRTLIFPGKLLISTAMEVRASVMKSPAGLQRAGDNSIRRGRRLLAPGRLRFADTSISNVPAKAESTIM
jgi:hypothetical protein